MTLWARTAISPAPSTGSSNFISTPATGVPIEPGLRPRRASLNEATGEVSDSP
jgi:hypothetical protein